MRSLDFRGFFLFYFSLACSNRTYGENCSKTCGKCRHSEQCHHINGTCSNGCDSGYQGDKCDKGEYLGCCYLSMPKYKLLKLFKLYILLINKKCVGGFFGQNCTQTCGTKCKGCNTVTGVCENGCHPGWEGHFCQTGWLGCFSSSC